MLLQRSCSVCHRAFSTARINSSYIGSAAIIIPQDVTVLDTAITSQNTRQVAITGPKGNLSLSVPSFISIHNDTSSSGATVTLKVNDPRIKQQRAMWGTTRALLANSITGVAEGYTVSIKFVGVGYRAALDGNNVVIRVGFSQPVVLTIPPGITAKCPIPTSLILEGSSKQDLTQFAAVIRSYRKPEPYKGKGIFVNGETIKLKSASGKK